MGVFHFKRFSVDDSGSAMKIGTDGVLLGAWARADGASAIVDVGSGTGLIALMMAQRYEDVPVVGIDVDASACEDAVANVNASPWSGRIDIVNDDILDFDINTYHTHSSNAVGHPLCIVSNPPFFTETLRSPDASRALARHGDGLGVGSLIAWAARMMTVAGDRLSFIAPVGHDDDIQYQLSLHRLAPVRMTDVVTREGRAPMRRLYEVARETDVSESCECDVLVIRRADGSYSQSYIDLTGQFYIKM